MLRVFFNPQNTVLLHGWSTFSWNQLTSWFCQLASPFLSPRLVCPHLPVSFQEIVRLELYKKATVIPLVWWWNNIDGDLTIEKSDFPQKKGWVKTWWFNPLRLGLAPVYGLVGRSVILASCLKSNGDLDMFVAMTISQVLYMYVYILWWHGQVLTNTHQYTVNYTLWVVRSRMIILAAKCGRWDNSKSFQGVTGHQCMIWLASHIGFRMCWSVGYESMWWI